MELYWFVIGTTAPGVPTAYDPNAAAAAIYGRGSAAGRDYITLLFWISNRIDSDSTSFIGIIGWNDLV